MLAKFFYPDELTVVIDHLKEEGDLNKDALKPLNFSAHYCALPLGFVGLCFSVTKMLTQPFDPDLICSIVLGALFILFYLPSYHQRFWRAFMIAYILGEPETGTVVSARVTIFWYGVIEVKLHNFGEIINAYTKSTATLLPPFADPSYMPVVGDQISVFVSKDKSHGAVPAIEGYMQKACLKKSLIKQHESEPETTVSGR